MNDGIENFMGYLDQPCEYSFDAPVQNLPTQKQSGLDQRTGYNRSNFGNIPARYHPYSSVPRYQQTSGNYQCPTNCYTVQSTYSLTEPLSYDRFRNTSFTMDNTSLEPNCSFGNSNNNNNSVIGGCSYSMGTVPVPSSLYGQVETQHSSESLYNQSHPVVSSALLSNRKEYSVNQRFSNYPTFTSNRSRLFQTMEIDSASSPEQDYSEVDAGGKKRGPKKRKKKGANEPQKPVSAYALFFRDTQAAIKAENPNATFGEISKIVASMWDSLSEEAKQVYKQKTESAKRDYLKQLAAYRANLVSRGGLDADEDESQPLSLLKIKMSDSNHSVLPPLPKLQMAPNSSKKDWSSSLPNVPETNLSSIPDDMQLGEGRAPSPSLVSVSFSAPNGNSTQTVQVSPGSQALVPPPIQLRNIVPKANSPVAFLPSKPGQVIKVLPASQAASIANSQSGRTRIIKMADMLRPVVSQASGSEVCSPTQSVQPILQMLAQENEVEQSNLSASSERIHFQPNNALSRIECIDLTNTPAPILESQEFEPVTNKFEDATVQYCIREGCNNVAVADPHWNKEYCSNECVVNHCRDVFDAWTSARKVSASVN
uniref:CAGF9 n=1 Tax=Phallusia mammillata TaxID=59560 RepID=A0A6F9DUQ6_9ASCI|nr:CAGF9 [Phallusia mammillata]